MNTDTLPEITSALTSRGMRIEFKGNAYGISYPEDVWGPVPDAVKQVLLDNLVYAAVMHLPMKFREMKGLFFHSGRPCFETYFLQNFIRDIPSCCDMDRNDIGGDMEHFLTLQFAFDDDAMKYPALWPAKPVGGKPGAIIPFSFGKDSLLTFALTEELGLEPVLVYVDEPGFSRERGHKEKLGRAFFREFGRELNILDHSAGLLRDDGHLGTAKNEYGWGLQSTEYALMMLPFARAHGAGYIFFGNEQTASTSYPDHSGHWTVHPCYDQSAVWTGHINAMTMAVTGGAPVRTGSLIEPLMDMMIQRILARRYPEYAKYQMSCFAEGEEGKHDRWCHNCSICAKMYLMCLGGGVDPRNIGFSRSMLTEEHMRYFSVFGGETDFPYGRTETARDEQLFALHCAARFGSEEPLVKKFRNSPLATESLQRESELFSRFASLYPAINLPGELSAGLTALFREEIDIFTRLYEGL